MNEIDPKSFWALNRSVLALGRTSVSVIILGFLLEKFDFFLKELSVTMPSSNLQSFQSHELFYHTLGLITVFAGIVLAFYTVYYYKQQLRFLKQGITQDNEKFFYTISFSIGLFGVIVFLAILFM